MPYIKPTVRAHLDTKLPWPSSAGELNYIITKLCQQFIKSQGGINYTNINGAIGVLECAKLELYRRIAAPYEDIKIQENGDVNIFNGE